MIVKSIHTLNARDHVMLEVMQQHFKLSPAHMFREIQGLRQIVEDTLAAKGIAYDALKTALVPDRQRREAAFVFDTMMIESSWYGNDVFQRVIPLFDRRSNHSVLAGDYLDRPAQGDQLFQAFQASVRLRRDVFFRHPTQFYIIYVNNLTEAMVERFDQGLMGYDAYVGFADMTYMSPFKLYLSTMLVNSFIKHGEIVLQGHEPDRSENEDVNMSGYAFETNGFKCRSISDDLMGVLLAYKIERPVFEGFESDTHFALNSVTASPLPLHDFKIHVDAAKTEYLRSQKAGSMARAGLLTVDSRELAEIIRAKVNGSYVYNMSFTSEYNLIKFNLMLELGGTNSARPTRLLASLEYQPEEKALRLITLY